MLHHLSQLMRYSITVNMMRYAIMISIMCYVSHHHSPIFSPSPPPPGYTVHQLGAI